MKALRPVDDAGFGAAIHWAVSERNVVVAGCRQHRKRPEQPLQPESPARQDDPGSWDDLVTIASRPGGLRMYRPSAWSTIKAPSTFHSLLALVGVAAPGIHRQPRQLS